MNNTALRYYIIMGSILGVVFILIELEWIEPINRYEAPNAWTIVRQRDHEPVNYGYITAEGFTVAGFTNKDDAIRVMKIEKNLSRHPPKTPEAPIHPTFERVE